MPSVTIKSITLSVIMLNVVAPFPNHAQKYQAKIKVANSDKHTDMVYPEVLYYSPLALIARNPPLCDGDIPRSTGRSGRPSSC
jgi:hypothetical protein